MCVAGRRWATWCRAGSRRGRSTSRSRLTCRRRTAGCRPAGGVFPRNTRYPSTHGYPNNQYDTAWPRLKLLLFLLSPPQATNGSQAETKTKNLPVPVYLRPLDEKDASMKVGRSATTEYGRETCCVLKIQSFRT